MAFQNVGSAAAVYIAASPADQKKITNLGGGTLYYASAASVSVGSNDGEVAEDDDVTIADGVYVIAAAPGTGLHIEDVTTDGRIELVSEDYSAGGSRQLIAADLNLAAAAGTSTAGDSSFLGGIMGNLLGAALTKTHNFIGGVIGAYSVETSNASDLPSGAVVAVLSDGSQGADGAVVAVLDNGDPGADTNATAAFKAMANTNRSGTSVEYGVDLYDAGRDSTLYSGGGTAFKVTKGDLRLTNQVVVMNGAGAPSNGTTGDNFAAVGSLYIDKTAGKLYINTGAIDNPTWTIVGTQS
jgi:hypothetical protein